MAAFLKKNLFKLGVEWSQSRDVKKDKKTQRSIFRVRLPLSLFPHESSFSSRNQAVHCVQETEQSFVHNLKVHRGK